MSPESIIFCDAKTYQPISEARAEFLDNYLIVGRISPGAQVSTKALLAGDRIVAINDEPVYDYRGFSNCVRKYPKGTKYQIHYIRGESKPRQTITVEGGDLIGIEFEP